MIVKFNYHVITYQGSVVKILHMSWIVTKKSSNRKVEIQNKEKFDEFILISTPKCGGYSIEEILTKNDYLLSRPPTVALLGHFTFLDTYHRIAKSEFSHINNYLIPVREPVSWRRSFYNYVKNKAQDSGQYYASELSKLVSFQEYIEMLTSEERKQIPSIDTLPFISRGSYITNKTIDDKIIKNINIYIYDMTQGFSSLFKNHFDIDLDDEVTNNSTSYSEDLKLSDELISRLNLFDDISEFNTEEYKILI